MEKLQEQVTAFLNELSEQQHLSVNTIDAYRNDIAQYMYFLSNQQGCSEWLNVDDLMVRKYFYWIQDQGSAAATVARKATAVRRFHRYLVGCHIRPDDPTYSMDTPKVTLHHLEVLTYPQIEQLLDAPDSGTPTGCRDLAMLELLYATGMHVSELIQLNLNDVHLDMGFVHCGGKKGRERILPIGKKAETALRHYIEDGRENVPEDECALFVNRRCRRLSRQGIWKILKQYAAIAGINQQLSPETLRQSLAAHLLENGADLLSVEMLMGRTSTLFAQRFSHTAKPLLKDFYRLYHPRA